MGYAYSNSTITNCYNTGSVSGTSTSSSANVGGVLGYANSSSTLTNCYNTGSVSGTSSSYAYVGGVVGYAHSSAITKCYNTGSVSGSSQSSAYVGGVVGYAVSNSAITNCYNTGAVSGTSASLYAYVGGVVGRVNSNSTITKSFAICNVYVNMGRVGGILGYMSSSSYTLNMTECFFEGTITTGASSSSSSYAVGGLVGYIKCASTGSSIKDCYAKATINAPNLTTITYIQPWIGYLDSTYKPKDSDHHDYYYDVTINSNSTNGVYGSSTNYREYNAGSDGNLDGDKWYRTDNLNNGEPILRTFYWIGKVAEEQTDIADWFADNENFEEVA